MTLISHSSRSEYSYPLLQNVKTDYNDLVLNDFTAVDVSRYSV